VVELLQALSEGRNPEPSFVDGVRAQAVLEAVLLSQGSRHWEKVPA
jgi:predicted dehydrogenase